MNPVIVRFLRDGYHQLPIPSYQSADAAGFDLAAAIYEGEFHPIDASLTLHPGQRAIVKTGFRVALPKGYEMQIRPRSGLAIKHGITVINSPGTIDADYRGIVCVGLVNLGQESFEIKHGDRIAQAVVAPVVQSQNIEVDQLDETARGSGGFGSTGRS